MGIGERTMPVMIVRGWVGEGGGARVQVHGPQQGDPALTFGLEHRVHGEARRDEHGVALRRC